MVPMARGTRHGTNCTFSGKRNRELYLIQDNQKENGMTVNKTTEVHLEALAGITRKSKTWLNERAKEGHFKSERHGVYRLGNVVPGIIAYYERLLKEKSQTAAQSELQKQKARLIEMRIAKEAGELIGFSLHCQIVDQVAGIFVTFLNGLPAQLTRDRAQRAEIERVIDAGRERLAANWARLTRITEDDGDNEGMSEDQAQSQPQ